MVMLGISDFFSKLHLGSRIRKFNDHLLSECTVQNNFILINALPCLRLRGNAPSFQEGVHLEIDRVSVLPGPEIVFRLVHQKSSANFGKSATNFGKSSANFTKTLMQHTHEGYIRNEVKVFLCL
jgi:hypothetical protein